MNDSQNDAISCRVIYGKLNQANGTHKITPNRTPLVIPNDESWVVIILYHMRLPEETTLIQVNNADGSHQKMYCQLRKDTYDDPTCFDCNWLHSGNPSHKIGTS